jgi:tetratricopeptide (TPR) repeat protein
LADLIPWTFLLPPLLVAVVAGIAVALRRRPSARATALLAEGGRHLNKGDSEGAERCFRAGLALAPENMALVGMMASFLVAEDRFDEALPFAEKAAKAQPDDHNLAVIVGECALGRGETQKALDLWAAIPASSSAFATAQQKSAAALEADGDLQAALEALDKAIEASSVHEARPLKAARKTLQEALDE